MLEFNILGLSFHNHSVTLFFCDFLQPIWSEREASVEFLSPGSSRRSPQTPFYPQRVFSRILNPKNPSKNWTTPLHLNTTPDADFSSEESLLSSSSDSEAENEVCVIDTTERGLNFL